MRLFALRIIASTLFTLLAVFSVCCAEPAEGKATGDGPLFGGVYNHETLTMVAISNDIPVGSHVAIVFFDLDYENKQRLVRAEVISGPVQGSSRIHFYDDNSSFIYRLKADSDYKVERGDIGIGVVGAHKAVSTEDKGILMDIDRNGTNESFAYCWGIEGLHMSVWSGKPFEGTKLWGAAYYLGHEVITTCKDMLPRSTRGTVDFELTAGGEPREGMAFVKGGCLQMGDSIVNVGINEKPLQEICVNNFYIDKTEVTQKAYMAETGRNPSKFKGCDDCPVESLNWFNAEAYCRKVGKSLPTEAEWEYAAKSGRRKRKEEGTSTSLDDYAWYSKNSGQDASCGAETAKWARHI